MVDQLQKEAEKYQEVWKQLEEIDTKCCVIDPERPTLDVCHRRIAIDKYCSIIIKIDPRNPLKVPEYQLLGPDSKIAELRSSFYAQQRLWSVFLSFIFDPSFSWLCVCVYVWKRVRRD